MVSTPSGPADPGTPPPDPIPEGERELVTSGSVAVDPENPALVSIELSGIIDPDTGIPYEDLSADNFVIVEDGVVQGFTVELIAESGITGMADIAFIVDTTGSMGEEIDGVKASLVEFLSYLETQSLDINVAGYAYADDVVEYVDFSSDISSGGSFYSWINGLSASRGARRRPRPDCSRSGLPVMETRRTEDLHLTYRCAFPDG